VAGQLGEVEGDKCLAEDDERPGPEDSWTANAEGDCLIGERAGRDRDVAERDGEVRQESQGSTQLGPAENPVLIMGNHMGAADPGVMISFFPERDIVPLSWVA
jgi:hypothetical protein